MDRREQFMLLRSAVRLGDLDFITQYLDGGGDIDAVVTDEYNRCRETMLLHAISRRTMVNDDKCTELVALLLRRGASVDLETSSGSTALHLACSRGSRKLDIASRLIDAGANITRRESAYFGATPLHSACAYYPNSPAELEEQKAVIRLLMEKGASMGATDLSGRTPVFCVRHSAIAAFLVDECGVEVAKTKDPKGNTPLFAVETREMALFLLERGLEVSARNNAGETPLHVAATRSSDGAVKALLEHGADIDALDNDGLAPIHHACVSPAPSQILIALMHWGPELYRRVPRCFGWPALGMALAGRLIEHLSFLQLRREPLEAPCAWLKWLVTSGYVEPRMFSGVEHTRLQLESLSQRDDSTPPPLTREEMLQPLKDYAWEKRKHLVCCYFETRRLRREAASKREAGAELSATARGGSPPLPPPGSSSDAADCETSA